MIIGRSNSCDLVIPEEEVSGEHCELRVLNGFLFLIDTNSTNGTFVNGERISARALTEGDVIQVGMTTLRATYTPSPEPHRTHAKESGKEETPDAPRAHAFPTPPPETEGGAPHHVSSARTGGTAAPPETGGESQPDGWLDRVASKHPFLLLAVSLAFVVSFFPSARLNAVELEIADRFITACVLTFVFVAAGLLMRVLWRIKRVILWGGFSLLVIYHIFANTIAVVIGVCVIVVLELIWRHFRIQTLILEELRRQRRK